MLCNCAHVGRGTATSPPSRDQRVQPPPLARLPVSDMRQRIVSTLAALPLPAAPHLPPNARKQLYKLHAAGAGGKSAVEFYHFSKAAGTSVCRASGD